MALKRLASLGWLQAEANKPGQATTYKRVINRHITLSGRYIKEIHVYGNDAPNDCSHECWVRLGKAARSVYYSLGVAPASARRVARVAGVASRTADRQLKCLLSFGLAKRCDSGWVIGDYTPDDVVLDMDWMESNSRVEQRKQSIEAQRKYFHWKQGEAA